MASPSPSAGIVPEWWPCYHTGGSGTSKQDTASGQAGASLGRHQNLSRTGLAPLGSYATLDRTMAAPTRGNYAWPKLAGWQAGLGRGAFPVVAAGGTIDSAYGMARSHPSTSEEIDSRLTRRGESGGQSSPAARVPDWDADGD